MPNGQWCGTLLKMSTSFSLYPAGLRAKAKLANRKGPSAIHLTNASAVGRWRRVFLSPHRNPYMYLTLKLSSMTRPVADLS